MLPHALVEYKNCPDANAMLADRIDRVSRRKMMKLWWIVALGVGLAAVAHAAPQGTRIEIKNAEGEPLGQLLLCSTCETVGEDAGKKCHEGAENGWLDAKACGSCLLKSNWGVMVRHKRDLVITGRLVLDDGTPAKKHYVKLFLPNGWGHRTQAGDDGKFLLRMGATAERVKGAPLTIDLGDRVDVTHEGNNQFSIFLMPDAFVACADGAKP
jgi:hypothetical protein